LNISPSSAGLKSKPNKKLEADRARALDFSSALKMEVIYSSETYFAALYHRRWKPT
jgi:hypothetical protein